MWDINLFESNICRQTLNLQLANFISFLNLEEMCKMSKTSNLSHFTHDRGVQNIQNTVENLSLLHAKFLMYEVEVSEMNL